jgi:hypothetical protein
VKPTTEATAFSNGTADIFHVFLINYCRRRRSCIPTRLGIFQKKGSLDQQEWNKGWWKNVWNENTAAAAANVSRKLFIVSWNFFAQTAEMLKASRHFTVVWVECQVAGWLLLSTQSLLDHRPPRTHTNNVGVSAGPFCLVDLFINLFSCSFVWYRSLFAFFLFAIYRSPILSLLLFRFAIRFAWHAKNIFIA